eukprot:CAMPEP_0206063178 /NCGR_PEP_ID=MMETSP1466-20131121/58098_1 /ASSEMBLY_ACC=CAM_ASM_001126 /TAXON_ID=44452 /ORGANISM="Pavlova gyrans, Strain CCMP608" /LENGTH=346 /DNA_ID=CAMNT_0053438547 /DNA_START=29 /DNA_END=1066 /DNA_ORIENTATION=-
MSQYPALASTLLGGWARRAPALSPGCHLCWEEGDEVEGLQRREEDIKHPEADEQRTRGVLEASGASQLAVRDERQSPDADDSQRDDGAHGEDSHGERERARVHYIFCATSGVVDGGEQPGQAEAQEDVNRVGPRHVADARVRVLVVDGGHLGGEEVGQRGAQRHDRDRGERVGDPDDAPEHASDVADGSREHCNHAERGAEGGVSVAVGSRRHHAEEYLPAKRGHVERGQPAAMMAHTAKTPTENVSVPAYTTYFVPRAVGGANTARPGSDARPTEREAWHGENGKEGRELRERSLQVAARAERCAEIAAGSTAAPRPPTLRPTAACAAPAERTGVVDGGEQPGQA